MSRSLPRWLVWSGLSLLAWPLWLVLVFGKFDSRVDQLNAANITARKNLDALQARIASVPTLVQRLNTSQMALDSLSQQYASVGELDRLMSDLTTTARHHGIVNAGAEPDLESILRLNATLNKSSSIVGNCDTLLIELSTVNSFRRIGHWLDGIEQRADFQHWVECRWSAGGEGDLARFDGLVALLVTGRTDGPANLSEANHGHE